MNKKTIAYIVVVMTIATLIFTSIVMLIASGSVSDKELSLYLKDAQKIVITPNKVYIDSHGLPRNVVYEKVMQYIEKHPSIEVIYRDGPNSFWEALESIITDNSTLFVLLMGLFFVSLIIDAFFYFANYINVFPPMMMGGMAFEFQPQDIEENEDIEQTDNEEEIADDDEENEDAHIPEVSFNDVAGIDEIEQEIKDILYFIKNPEKYEKMGARPPKGVLLAGPPGVGKTLIGKALAHEAGVPFFYASGAEFIELYVGVGAKRIRELFKKARKNAPAIVFIDEIDAIAGIRGAGPGGNNMEDLRTLTQLLTEMDGVMVSKKPIVVIAATNKPELIDPALLRPGRFDKVIHVNLPHRNARRDILLVHLRNKPLAVDKENLAEQLADITVGFSGADLENLCNEAALIALKKGKTAIEKEDFMEAFDKIMLGLTNGLVLDDKQKKTVAIHESGHAIVAHYLKKKIDIVTILPRSRALGLVLTKPEERYIRKFSELFAEIVVDLGGRAAEELYDVEPSTGAANDLAQATQMARAIVAEYGFGNLAAYEYGEYELLPLPETVNEQVRYILSCAYETAKKILIDNKQYHEKLTNALLEKEVIRDGEILDILDGMPQIEKIDGAFMEVLKGLTIMEAQEE